VSTGNGKSDALNFGKFKGRKIADVLKIDPQYCCWLRDKVAKDSSQAFFDQDVNDELDMWIALHKKDAARFRHWTKNPPTFLVKVTTDAALDEDEQAIADILSGRTPLNGHTPMPEPVVAYTPSADWGSW
jgi:hypothetical protein